MSYCPILEFDFFTRLRLEKNNLIVADKKFSSMLINGQDGSTYFPFFSWLSLYGEFGFVGCGLLLLLIIFFCKRLVENVNQNNFILILGLLIVVIYIFLLGVQDNYWEWSQFILPIVLFSKAIYYVVMKD